MNTNSNTYTIIYTTLVVVVVAAVLAFVSSSLNDRQVANEKADTISQMLTAAQLGSKDDFQAMGNANVLAKYSEAVAEAIVINVEGETVRTLDIASQEIFYPSDLKKQNDLAKAGNKAEIELPVYVLDNATIILPVYGAGLWGPVWGYIALDSDRQTIKGAYFDHASETPGLGAKIKDDPAFQAEFCGEKIDLSASPIFEIVKGGAPKADGKSVIDNKIDAISGATMTSNGLAEAINAWLGLYKAYLCAAAPAAHECNASCTEGECGHEDCAKAEHECAHEGAHECSHGEAQECAHEGCQKHACAKNN